jgi:dTDP-4-dehydrorhamnose reductase
VEHVMPARTEDLPTAARPPAGSSLCCDRFEAAYGLRLPEWDAALRLEMEEGR